MRGTRNFGSGPMDLGSIFDEIFEAARNFHDEFTNNLNNCHAGFDGGRNWAYNENIDYYPGYSYPPMNVYMTGDRSLIFEFALAGFDEKDVSLSFQGDYMIFQAQIGGASRPQDTAAMNGINHLYSDGESQSGENIRYFKRRLKLKDIEKQKYFVPLDKYAQDKVKAVFRNGILRVSIPPKEEPDQSEGVKIEIITEN